MNQPIMFLKPNKTTRISRVKIEQPFANTFLGLNTSFTVNQEYVQPALAFSCTTDLLPPFRFGISRI
jgi:hypothetical protein